LIWHIPDTDTDLRLFRRFWIFFKLYNYTQSIHNIFTDCPSLERINAAPDNPAYLPANGVVYSKDAKTLPLHPAQSQVPLAGVDAIGVWAFRSAPAGESPPLSSVRALDCGAFAESPSLKSIRPGGVLESVGGGAFSSCALPEDERNRAIRHFLRQPSFR